MLVSGGSWLSRWWPSTRVRTDPLEGFHVEGRYVPVSITNFKLIPSVAREVLAKRVAQPLSFSAAGRLTVVIPYRDRARHLEQLLPLLSAQLRKQGVRYRILVVEQGAGELFNRGRLLNIGMHLASETSDYYCLHDVDAVPVVANYLCPSQPLRLMNSIMTTQGSTRRADHYFSGAVSLRKEQVFAAHGYSNEYWGWGKEDDDFFFRLLRAGSLCYFDTQGIFHDLPNPQHQQIPRSRLRRLQQVKQNRLRRSLLLRGLADPAHDGLATVRYEILERSEAPEYDKVTVRW